MKPRLNAFASNVTSQFGEDGCLAHILEQIGGAKHKTCVEFGAGDGMSCSNTARLWQTEGWRALLIEPDRISFEVLEGNARLFDTVCRQAFVTPKGPQSIGEVMEAEGFDSVDFMSIDVDGDDYEILSALDVRPRVISVEFNPTVPPHMELRQADLGGTFGASLLAFIRLAPKIHYRFVGATYCNAFLVDEIEAAPFNGYEVDPIVLLGPENFTYAVTDFSGRLVLAGRSLPWDAKDPYVLPLESSTNVILPTNSAQQLRRGFESLWGPAMWLSPNGLSPEKLQAILAVLPRLVCIDVSTAAAETVASFETAAATAGYRHLHVGQVLGLINR